jgi:hypothetical protein
MFGINSWYAGRWRRDAPWLLGGVAFAFVAIFSSTYWLPKELMTPDSFRLAHRVLALLLAGVWYARLRPSLRAQELMGTTAASPWLAAIAAIALGYAANLAAAAHLGFLR